MDEKQLLALAKKNAARSAQAEKAQKKARKTYDSTLEVTRPAEESEGSEADEIFREMKKRSF